MSLGTSLLQYAFRFGNEALGKNYRGNETGPTETSWHSIDAQVLALIIVFLFQNGRYGINVCGEGGEYETFTLNCPLFEKKIIM